MPNHDQEANRPVRAGWAVAFALVWIVALGLAFQPRWETNDDLGMAMVAHGFGLAAWGAPTIVFSNVIWGALVHALPTVGGVVGYSWGTMALLALAAGLIVHAVGRSRTGFALGMLVAAVCLLRPVLFPQFTMTAGFLTVAAVAAARRAVEHEERPLFWLALVSAWLAFLVRAEECVLVLAVSLPVMPWRTMGRLRWVRLALVAWGVAVLLAVVVDRRAYAGPEWTRFKAVNVARLPIIDYGGWERLRARPDILARHHYQAEDLDLVRNWFFVDPAVAASPALTAMQAELGPRPVADYRGLTRRALEGFLSPRLWPLAALGCALMLVGLDRLTLLSWLIAVSAMVALGVAGRPAVLRVYEPVLGLLAVAPLLRGDWRQKRAMMAGVLLVVVGVGLGLRLAQEQKVSQAGVAEMQRGLRQAGLDRALIWGGDFKTEYAYPVLGGVGSLRLEAFDSFELAPWSNMMAAENAGDGIVARLLRGGEVNLLSSSRSGSKIKIRLLRSYLRRYHHRELRVRTTIVNRGVMVDHLTCAAAPLRTTERTEMAKP